MHSSLQNRQIIQAVKSFVKNKLTQTDPGHDYWHALRVGALAGKIAQKEEADPLLSEVAGLLHDVADHKFVSPKEAELVYSQIADLLQELKFSSYDIKEILNIVQNMSYSKNPNPDNVSLEFKIVQDADRLDAMGAIGVARAFSFGGARSRPMYDPGIPPSKEPYTASNKNSPTINHFYEKLLLLKDSLHTKTARNIANDRHQFMQAFLEQFFREWNAADPGLD